VSKAAMVQEHADIDGGCARSYDAPVSEPHIRKVRGAEIPCTWATLDPRAHAPYVMAGMAGRILY
jgi:hypothetical protein